MSMICGAPVQPSYPGMTDKPVQQTHVLEDDTEDEEDPFVQKQPAIAKPKTITKPVTKPVTKPKSLPDTPKSTPVMSSEPVPSPKPTKKRSLDSKKGTPPKRKKVALKGGAPGSQVHVLSTLVQELAELDTRRAELIKQIQAVTTSL